MADHAHRELTDDLDALLAALPPEIVAEIRALSERTDLIEVVMDLGRRPEARFPDSEVTAREATATPRERLPPRASRSPVVPGPSRT